MKQLLATKGKLLGVDFGDKRTGLAISNDMRTLASGITQISVGGMQKTAAAVAEVARDRAVVGVVVLVVMGMTALARRIEEGKKDKAE